MITRRVFGKAAAMAAGGVTAPRADQQMQARSAAPAPPAVPGSVFFIIYIVGAKGGLFVYSPTAGAGNLVASIAGMAGTDKYGNAYLAGVVSYNLGVGGPVALEMYSGGLAWYEASSYAGPWVQEASVEYGSSTGLTVSALSQKLIEVASQVLLSASVNPTAVSSSLLEVQGDETLTGTLHVTTAGVIKFGPGDAADLYYNSGTGGLKTDEPFTAIGGSAASPTLITTDSWQTVSYVNTEWADYTGGSNLPLRYRLTADGMVEILGAFAYTSAGSALTGSNAFTSALPSGYQPVDVVQIPCMVIGGTGTPTITANRVPVVQISTGGVLTLENVSGAGTTGQTAVLACMGRYRIS